MKCGSESVHRTQYADFVPHSSQVLISLDRHRDVVFESIGVYGNNYTVNGNGFWGGDDDEDIQFWANFSAEFPFITSTHINVNSSGGDVHIVRDTIPLNLYSRDDADSDERKKKIHDIDTTNAMELKFEFTFPDSHGTAELSNAVLNIGETFSFMGAFTLHTPLSMRKRGATRDVIIVEGALNSKRGSITLSMNMRADDNFEQEFSMYASAKNIDDPLIELYIEDAIVKLDFTRFPFDPHGTAEGTLSNIVSPTLSLNNVSFMAMREAFHTRVMHTKYTIRYDRHEDLLKVRPWLIAMNASGQTLSCRTSAQINVNLAEERINALVYPSIAQYRSLNVWTDEMSTFSFHLLNNNNNNNNQSDWKHSARTHIRTMDTNGTLGHIRMNIFGDQTVTHVQSNFSHSLGTVSQMAYEQGWITTITKPKQKTRRTREELERWHASRTQNEKHTNTFSPVQGYLEGHIHLTHNGNQYALHSGSVHLTNGSVYTNVYSTCTNKDEALPYPMVYNATGHANGTEQEWIIHSFSANTVAHGYVTGDGHFTSPIQNNTLVPISLRLVAQDYPYVKRASITIEANVSLP